MLFERGLVDPKVKKYTQHGQKVDGIVDVETSMSDIMGNCEDFRNETTEMAELLAKLGVQMEQTPRKHPELAGEGVEYSWGKGKPEFRRSHDYNPNAASLERRVRAALDSSTVLTRPRIRKFIRRGNEYKRAYRELENGQQVDAGASAGSVTHTDIEQMKRDVKAHRSTKDQDLKFIQES